MDGPQEGAHSLPELLTAGYAPPPDPGDEDAIAHLSYTSGTTGQPKGACLRHEPTVRASRCIAERLRIRPRDVSFGPTALSSSYQLVGNLLPPLAVGAPIHVMGRWTQVSGFDALDAAGATILVGNPPLLEEVLTESRTRGRPPGRLRFVLSGGGAGAADAEDGLARRTCAFRWSRATARANSAVSSRWDFPSSNPMMTSSCGSVRRCPTKRCGCSIRMTKRSGSARSGDIALRGGFMAGYWGRPEKTAEATRGGWLRTGDLGALDADGYLTMRSRRAELIEVAGVPWYPRDVEEALCRIAGIRQAALVGVADGAAGVRPAAFVTLHSDAQVSAAALKSAIRPALSYDLEPLTVTHRDPNCR